MKSKSAVRSILACLALAAGLLTGPPRAGESPEILPEPDLSEGTPFLLEQTEVRAVVSGPVAHVVVTQAWENPNPMPVDGIYIFPLPENAAVNGMSLRIGERRIEADIKRREEARAIYERARSEGRVAGLLDQERPNIFAQRVANIMPGVMIDVTLEFDHEIHCERDGCEYVFPTVVGPRFIPADQTDPGQIAPPIVAEGRNTRQRLDLVVDLDSGVPMRGLESPSHRVTISRDGESRARIALAEGEAVLLNRDFRLRWSVGSDAPEAGLLSWRDPVQEGEPGVFTLILQPPAAPREEGAAARELIFVLDCSGSMRGVPLEAAKKVVRQSLGALRPNDTFQIIRFSERASGLGPSPLPPTPDNIRKALAHLSSLQGQGGTHMIEGIRAALTPAPDPERIRIVALLTDGYIGNESQILGEVRRSLGSARLFSFGIGSSVNRYLLEGLAEEGRGAAAFLGPRETPDELVERFVARIATPVLTDIQISWEDLEVGDLEPPTIPDLFAGEPLVIHGRYKKPGTGLVVIEGNRAGRAETMRRVVTLHDLAKDHEALGRLWARARIHRLTRELHDGMREDLKESIVALGLRHHLMTAWTSLVAVDSFVSNTTGSSTQVTVPVEMPEDVSYEGIFGNPRMSLRKRTAPAMAMGDAGSLSQLATRALLAGPVALSPKPSLDEEEDRSPHEGITRDERRESEAGADMADRFSSLTLHQASGICIVVEADGEIWKVEGRTRRLVRALTAVQMESLRAALRSARPESWSGGESAERLVLRGPGMARSIPLPSADPGVQRLVRLILEDGSL